MEWLIEHGFSLTKLHDIVPIRPGDFVAVTSNLKNKQFIDIIAKK